MHLVLSIPVSEQPLPVEGPDGPIVVIGGGGTATWRVGSTSTITGTDRSELSRHDAGDLGTVALWIEQLTEEARRRGIDVDVLENLPVQRCRSGAVLIVDTGTVETLLEQSRAAGRGLTGTGRFAWQAVPSTLAHNAPAPDGTVTLRPGTNVTGRRWTATVDTNDGIVLTDIDGSRTVAIEFYTDRGRQLAQDPDGNVVDLGNDAAALRSAYAGNVTGDVTWRRALGESAFAQATVAFRTATVEAVRRGRPILLWAEPAPIPTLSN